MASAGNEVLLRHIHRLADTPASASAPDCELIERFTTHNDEPAFEALLRRHGPMVLRVCQRVLWNPQDAEDAFQATFLLLARKAGSVRRQESVGSWLYGVAYRVALSARAAAARRFVHERQVTALPAKDPLTEITLREAQRALDTELNRLAEKYRAPLVLCCLEGMTRDEAARQLGVSLTTLKSRLERGRQLLRVRLTRRGLMMSSALCAGFLAEGAAQATLPAALAHSTIQGAARCAAKISTEPVHLAPNVLALSEGVLRAATGMKWKVCALVLLAAGVLVGGGGLLIRNALRSPTVANQLPAAAEVKSPPDSPATRQARADLYGEPLPDEAITRMGTTRLRHGSGVGYLRFTPDGKTLVSQGGDGVRTWDVATGRHLHHFFPKDAVSLRGGSRAALSPDGKRVALSGNTGISIWDIETGKPVRTVGEGSYGQVDFSPDGSVLAAGGYNLSKKIDLWDAATGRPLPSLSRSEDWVGSFVFADRGKTVIASGETTERRQDKQHHAIWFWDVASGEVGRQIDLGESGLGKMALSPDGTMLAGVIGRGSKDAEGWCVHLWDTASTKELRTLKVTPKPTYRGRWNSFCSLVFAPDGKTLYAGGVDATVIGWDPHTGNEVRRVGQDLANPFGLAIAPDGKMLAANFASLIHLIDIDSGKERFTEVGHPVRINTGAISSDGRTVVTADFRRVFLWDAATGRQLGQSVGAEGGHTSFSQLPDGRSLLVSDYNYDTRHLASLRVLELATGKELRRIKWATETKDIRYPQSISPDGKTLALAGDKDTVYLVDFESGQIRQTLQGNDQSLLASAFTPDSATFIAAYINNLIRFWDVATGRIIREFEIPEGSTARQGPVFANGFGPGYRAAISADTQLIALAGSSAQVLEIYDLTNWRLIFKGGNTNGDVSHLIFSPDSKTLAWIGGSDGTVHLMELATGRERHRLVGRWGEVTALAFSADGRKLLSCNEDTTALVWDLTGRLAAGNTWSTPVTANELDACWSDLAEKDAAHAYQSIRKLASASSEAVAYLSKRLTPVPAADEQRLARLIKDLDSDNFKSRQKATKELEGLGEVALSACEKALADKPSLEVRQRLQTLLSAQQEARWSVTPERLRMLRSIETLELSRTAEARQLLVHLAKGAPGARLTEEAKSALRRIDHGGSTN
jgi:RNA polymerase sigma factor (sigma-70 family)